jgi:hypothetical protein
VCVPHDLGQGPTCTNSALSVNSLTCSP